MIRNLNLTDASSLFLIYVQLYIGRLRCEYEMDNLDMVGVPQTSRQLLQSTHLHWLPKV